MRPTPINECEAVLWRLYDPLRSGARECRFTADAATGGRLQSRFHATVIEWERGEGRVVGRLERDLAADLSGYDHVILCATLPATARVTANAVVDGQARVLFRGVAGTNTSEEYEAPLRGRALSRVAIEVVDSGPGPGLAQFFWLGVFNGRRRRALLARPGLDPAGAADLTVPPGSEVRAAPRLGLFFGDEDLPRIRRRATGGPYRVLMDRLRALARAEADADPWEGVGAYPNRRKPRCYRPRGPEPISGLAMRLGAFVGLLDEDEALLRMALNHALALAHCDHWQPEFLPTLPGSAWEQRAFYEYRFAQNLIFAWDWAGALLTPAGEQLMAQVVSTKALPWILQTLMRHPYVRGCNQGVYISWGAILCELALSRVYRRADELLDAAVRAMDETVKAYFAPDGGAFEGMGYVSATLGHALPAYAALARRRGCPMPALAPPVLKRTPDYLRAMLSTVPPVGSAVRVADGGRAGVCVYPDGLGLLHGLTGDPAIAALMAGILEGGVHETAATPGAIFCLLFGPDELPPARVQPPVFHILDHTGMLCSCRDTPAGPVRFELVGGPAQAGHAHDDRGSFVIEAFGEELALERGQMPYDDPRCALMQHARCHNVLIPETADSALPRQRNPCPAATIPRGEGGADGFRASVDVTAAWGGDVHRCVRAVESRDPLAFLVADEVDLAAERRVSFHVHSRYPWRPEPGGWHTEGQKGRLRVSPEWTPVAAAAEEDGVDGEKRPVHHLTLIAAPAREHRLRTWIRVEPIGAAGGRQTGGPS